MRFAAVKIKASFEIVACVILVQCLNFKNYAEANEKKNVTNTRINRNTCLLKPDTGPCRGNILMHYYDPKQGSCKRFAWGGCQGNGNRFDSREDCYSNCVSDISSLANTRPRFCNLNFDYGYCFGAVKRYYYDHLWKVCKERLFSGCGGNKNNFYNMEQCDSICSYGNGFIKANQMKKGQVRKVIIVNPPAATTKGDPRIQVQKATGAKGLDGEDGYYHPRVKDQKETGANGIDGEDGRAQNQKKTGDEGLDGEDAT